MLEVDFEQLDSAFTFRHHKWILLERPSGAATLLEALRIKFPDIDPATWSERLAWGSCYVNGARTLEFVPLPIPCLLEYYEPTFPLEQSDIIFNRFTPQHVVYEDEYLLGVFKPARLSCMPARDQMLFNLKDQVEAYTKCSLHLPSRLDFSVCGLVMMSKHPLMHNKLQRLYEHRAISKRYRLETSATVPWKDNLCTLPIGRDSRHPVLRSTESPEGKPARTEFRSIEIRPDTSLLEARPITGRTHQIRVHAAALGCPIRGDKFYGGASAPDLLLVSYEVFFAHPITHAPLQITLPHSLAPTWARENLK